MLFTVWYNLMKGHQIKRDGNYKTKFLDIDPKFDANNSYDKLDAVELVPI